MLAGFYSPYLDTYGGGERYVLTLASHLSKKDRVDVIWNDNGIKAPVSKFLKIDLTHCRIVPNFFGENRAKKIFATRKYDLLFVLSDGSVPFSLAKKNILHFQVPFTTKIDRTNALKLKKYQHVVVNSYFTKRFIDNSYGVESKVIYPPVDVKSLRAVKKEKIILSVGRFGDNQLHPKKQEVLIEVFKELYKDNKDWRLYLAGHAKKEDLKYVRHLKKSTRGLGIKILVNLSQVDLRDLYSKSSIYWHATGFGEDEQKNPQKMEHFGISTVEASASGAVPIVINAGGQKEIIQHLKNGLLWSTKSQLLEETHRVIEDKSLMKKLAQAAVGNSKIFSKDVFIKNYEKIIY